MNKNCKCNESAFDLSLLDDYMLELSLDYHYGILKNGGPTIHLVTEKRKVEVKIIYEALLKEKQRRYEEREASVRNTSTT